MQTSGRLGPSLSSLPSTSGSQVVIMTKPKREPRSDFDLDYILEDVSFGKYQILTHVYILLTVLFSAIFINQYIFAAGAVKYRRLAAAVCACRLYRSQVVTMTKPKDDPAEVHLDSILEELGSFGKYQIMNYGLILLPIMFSAVFASQYIFAAGDVEYRCEVPECEASPPNFNPNGWGQWALPVSGDGCERLVPVDGKCTADSFHVTNTVTCSSWIYESNNTIVAEFNLACQEWKRTLVGTVHNAGVIAALLMTALVSDAFGRKTAFIVTATASGGVGIIRSFSQSYTQYLVLEFLDASVGAGVYSTGFILALEMVGRNRRVLGGNIISGTFALGQVLLALFAWAFPYWRTLTRVIYTPVLFFIFYYFIVEESVRWLLSKGRKKEAARIIFKAAAMNKKKLSPASIKMLTEEPEEASKTPTSPEAEEHHVTDPTDEPKKRSVFMQVLKSKTLMSRVFICAFWWITVTFIYYGLSINSVSLAGNKYVNYILTSLVEIPGYAFSFLTLDRFGRKSSIITAFFICGIALISFPFVPIELSWLQITLNMVGKLAISMAFSSIYIYTSELFPTQARHSLLGLCSMLGRIGSLLAPQTPLLVAYMESLPYLLFGIMAACSGCLMLLTPETLRIRLPDTVEQAENIMVAPRSKRRTDIIVD